MIAPVSVLELTRTPFVPFLAGEIILKTQTHRLFSDGEPQANRSAEKDGHCGKGQTLNAGISRWRTENGIAVEMRSKSGGLKAGVRPHILLSRGANCVRATAKWVFGVPSS